MLTKKSRKSELVHFVFGVIESESDFNLFDSVLNLFDWVFKMLRLLDHRFAAVPQLFGSIFALGFDN